MSSEQRAAEQFVGAPGPVEVGNEVPWGEPGGEAQIRLQRIVNGILILAGYVNDVVKLWPVARYQFSLLLDRLTGWHGLRGILYRPRTAVCSQGRRRRPHPGSSRRP